MYMYNIFNMCLCKILLANATDVREITGDGSFRYRLCYVPLRSTCAEAEGIGNQFVFCFSYSISIEWYIKELRNHNPTDFCADKSQINII